MKNQFFIKCLKDSEGWWTEGEGWFVGSIHDTEDGAVCIWLRNKGGAA
ncbi:hypothetical protein MPC93_005083 [Salmonella enterica]|nr:hypothetical protein [Salmonella enterica subsp. enterica serovar Glostrup]EIZ6793016.1 hypothetical protein [Salmonella enterica]